MALFTYSTVTKNTRENIIVQCDVKNLAIASTILLQKTPQCN